MLKPLLAVACLTTGIVLAGCGLITASVSVPEAFSHNNNLGIKGSIADDQGVPVDDVVVTVRREYYLWHADASYPEFDTTTLLANRVFDVPARRAHELTFTFRKAGYADQTITVGQHAIKADYRWIEGDEWPLESPVQVILQKADRQPPPMRWLALEVDYTDPSKVRAIDLSKALQPSADPGFGWSRDRTMTLSQDALKLLAAGEALPANGLVAVIERQPTKTTGPERRVDPLDLNLPAQFALNFSTPSPDTGFISFTPAAGANPLAQMAQAPENGYVPELVLTEKRLRQLRTRTVNMVAERNEFFYFHSSMGYGKGVISWTRNADETGPLRLFYALMIQPDGSRNLATRNEP